SLTISRTATRWPAASMRSFSAVPERSLSRSRVSETVRTAMLTERKGLDSSIPGIAIGQLDLSRIRGIDRPIAGGKRVQRLGRLAEARLVDPEIAQDVLEEDARLGRGNALDE